MKNREQRAKLIFEQKVIAALAQKSVIAAERDKIQVFQTRKNAYVRRN